MSNFEIPGFDTGAFVLPPSVRQMYRSAELSMRAQQITRVNPYMWNNPQALMTLANTPMELPDLVRNSAAMYGIQVSDDIRNQLQAMTPEAQRATFSQLTPAQQMALFQSGYQQPKREEDEWYETLIRGAGEVVGKGFGVLGDVAGALQLDDALNVLIWLGDRPAHLYRTIRMMPEWSQIAALGGAALGVAALFAAPFTAGTSLALFAGGTLMTSAVVGGAALAGATTVAALTNPDDWAEAFKKGWGGVNAGERTYLRENEQRANEILGDPRLINAAKGIAELLPANVTVRDVAYAIAGQRGDGDQIALKAITDMAKRFAPENTPEYQRVVDGMSQLLTVEQFREAVDELQRGKISIGRDIADWFTPFEQGTKAHSFISGTVDAFAVMALDPLLVGTKIAKVGQVKRYGVVGSQGEAFVQRFLDASRNNKAVARLHEQVAKAVDLRDANLMRRQAPEFQELFDDLVAHRDSIASSLGNDGFTVERFREWVQANAQMAPILQGYGTVRGLGGSVQLARITKRKELARKVSGQIGAFTNGLTDVQFEKGILEVIERAMKNGDEFGENSMYNLFTERLHTDLRRKLLTKHINVINDRITTAFRRFEDLDDAAKNTAIAEARADNAMSVGMDAVLTDGRTVNLDGLDKFDPTIVPALQEAQRIRAGAVAMEELSPRLLDLNILEEMALAGEDFVQARALGRMLGKSGTLASFGNVVKKISTMAPSGGWVQLEGKGALQSVRNFVEMSAVGGMPEWMRREWVDMLMSQPSGNMRLTQVQQFYDNMLRIGGVDQLPEGEELIATFLNSVRKAYGGGGLDIVDLKTHWSRRSLLLDEMAEGVSMPDLREISRMMRRGYTAKVMNLVDNNLVEGFQSKVWKPSVLLRIGFIPRAAGEEMLSFLMRGGMGQLGQEFGARSLARADRYYKIQQRIASGRVRLEQLSREDRRLMEVGALPGEARFVARQLARSDYTHPMNQVITAYAEFRNNMLREGFIGEATERTWARIAGAPLPISPTNAQAGMLSAQMQARTGMPLRRYALGLAVDSIVLGNPFSWRRMAAGGVHDDLLDAAHQFYDKHGTTVLRTVGATNAAPVQMTWNDADAIQIRLDSQDSNGTVEQIVMVPIRGQRKVYFRGGQDPAYDNAIHESQARLADDELASSTVLPHIARLPMPGMRPTGIDDLSVIEANRLTETTAVAAVEYHGISGYNAKTFIDEFIDEPDYERLKAIVNQMRSNADEDIAQLGEQLAIHLPASNPTLQDVLRAFESTQSPPSALFAVPQPAFPYDRDVLRNFVDNVMPRIERLTNDQRTWLAAYLRHTDGRHALKLADQVGLKSEATDRLMRYFGDTYADVTPINNTWDELRATALPELKGAIRDPKYASKLGLTQGLSDVAGQAQKGDVAEQARGMAQIWVPRHGNTVTVSRNGTDVDIRISDMTVDDLVALIPDRQFAAENYTLLEFWLQQRQAGREVAFANRRVADEITRAVSEVGASTGTNPGVARAYAVDIGSQQLRPTDARFMEVHNVGSRGINAWSVKELTDAMRQQNPERIGAFRGRYRMPGNTTDELIDEFAEDLLTFVQASVTYGTRRQFRPRTRKLDDGTYKPVVYEKDINGELVPVPESRRYTERNEQLYNSRGEAITVGNNMYFLDEINELGEQVMIPVMGRVLQDAADARSGRMLLARKETLGSTVGYKVDPNEVVRLYRSKPAHVRNLNDTAPQWVEGIAYTPLKRNAWEKFVQYGFNRVIGPSIDALARRPMAFHFFAKRYMQNMRLREWLRNPQMLSQVDDIAARVQLAPFGMDATTAAKEARDVATFSRQVAAIETGGLDATVSWSQGHALAWLRSHNVTDFDTMLARVETQAAVMRSKNVIDDAQLADVRFAAAELRSRGHDRLRQMLPENMLSDDFLAYVRAELPEFRNMVDNEVNVSDVMDLIRDHPTLGRLDANDWGTLVNAQRNFDTITTEAGEAAAIAAINDMIPFIDSHEIKTQMAEIGKPFLPFWYAEENFMKRWVRTLKNEGPAVIRKAQLTYMGLKSAGTIRSDSTGRDWFIWPGSGLLADALQKLPFTESLPVGVIFKSPTDSILPGFNSRVGTPQFGPLVALPVDFMVMAFPELESAQRNIIGEIGASQGVLEQVIPSPLLRTFRAISGDETDRRYMSAYFSALSFLEATGNGVAADATPGERDEFLRKVRNHTRVILLTQAIGGWISPGPLTQEATPDQDWFNGQDPAQVLNPIYLELIQSMGIDKGTQRYLEIYPNTTVGDLVTSPMAVTVGRTESRSGAPLPATEMAVAFYELNSNYLDALPYASPWLLPTDEALKTPASLYAYDQQTVEGLRLMQTPEEFLTELKFKEASGMYFEERTKYLDKLEAARLNNNRTEVSRLNMEWQNWSKAYKANHPVFAERLESSDTRQRRGRVISEMRIAVNDPDAPQTSMMPLLREMIFHFDRYTAHKATLSLDGSTRGRARVEGLKGRFEKFMDDYITSNPQVRSFWLSVLRPESALD